MTADNSNPLKDAANRFLLTRDGQSDQSGGGPLIAVEGQGIRVVDTDGNSWIDVNGGGYSLNVGYGRSEIAEAIYDQMAELPYFPQKTAAPSTVRLCEKLAEITPGSLSRVFPVSGGSEANETALKIARAYHRRRGEPGRYKVISRRGSYHGATAGVHFLGSSPGTEFEPAYPGTLYAPQPDPYRCELGGRTASECAVRCAKAIEELILFHDPSTVAAVIAEPVTNTGIVPGEEYWPMVREICNEYGVVLIADEVTTGFGRTGRMFGVEHWDVEPDIMVVAGGMAGGYAPMGATIVRREIADRFSGEDNYFRHVVTFAGHPVSAAAALKTIQIIEQENLVENAAEAGSYLREALDVMAVDHPIVGDVRGLGLLQALELVNDRATKTQFPADQNVGKRLTTKLGSRGLILQVKGTVMTIAPPLCVTKDEVDEIVHAIDLSLWELEGELGIAIMA